MTQFLQQQKLLRVLGDLCNDQLASQDEAWLQEIMVESAQARSLYMDYMELDACLDAEGSALVYQGLADQASAEQSRGVLDSTVDRGLVTLARELVHQADAQSGFGSAREPWLRES
jgi:hypothetical protein